MQKTTLYLATFFLDFFYFFIIFGKVPRSGCESRIKILVFTDISVLSFYGYIGDISIFINYSNFKYIFNLYIKISLKVYEMKTFHFLPYRLGFPQIFIIINDSN